MTCGFDKGLLAALYDGEVTPEERAEAERHAASCPDCARDLASMKELSGALKPLARASAPMSIAEGVLRGIESTRPARRPWIQGALSAAAALLLVVGTVYLLNGRDAKSVKSVAIAREDKVRAAESRDSYRESRPGAKANTPVPSKEAPSQAAESEMLRQEAPPAADNDMAKDAEAKKTPAPAEA